MCGLAGYVGGNPDLQRELVTRMLSRIEHRGPDSTTYDSSKNTFIGFNRLAINDLTLLGNQPFKFKNITVYCNGEIYNHRELRRQFDLERHCRSCSDIELIPILYHKFGLDFLRFINGMFVMVIVDNNNNRVHIISDRWAKKPLYYKNDRNGFYFASELKSFLLEFDNEIDKELLNLGFYLGLFLTPTTPIKNILKLPPATILTISDGRVESRIWYSFKPDYDANKMLDHEIHDRYYELLDDSVKIRMRADVEAGVFLSGGMDSTTVTESAQRNCDHRVHTFTGVVEGKEYSTDNTNSLRFAKTQNVTMHRVDINHNTYDELIVNTCGVFDDIPFESCILNFLAITRKASQHVKILLDGVGGDELFLGYSWHEHVYNIPLWRRGRFGFLRNALFDICKKDAKSFHRLLLYTDIKKYPFIYRSYVPYDLMKSSSYFNVGVLCDLLDKTIPAYTGGFEDERELNCLSFIENLAMRMEQYSFSDRTCMAASIENRSPLSDYRLWEFLFGVSEKRKLMHGKKGMMREISDRLPKYITRADKDGFSSPAKVWFEQNPILLKSILDYLNKNIDIVNELLGDALVSAIMKGWQGNNSAPWKDGILLHMLLSVLIWYQIYFEKKINISDKITFSEFSQL